MMIAPLRRSLIELAYLFRWMSSVNQVIIDREG
jgi:hypothetical protein